MTETTTREMSECVWRVNVEAIELPAQPTVTLAFRDGASLSTVDVDVHTIHVGERAVRCVFVADTSTLYVDMRCWHVAVDPAFMEPAMALVERLRAEGE